jgi:uncharacterized phosphosugar-binding protein
MTERIVATVLLCVAVGATAGAERPAQEYARRVLVMLDKAQEHAAALLPPAEAAAERLAAGGSLWLGGSHQGFIIEGYYRAGGMIGAKRLEKSSDLRSGDVLLLGSLDPAHPEDVALARSVRAAGAYVIAFTPRVQPSPLAAESEACLVADAPVPSEDTLPTASVGLAANLWAFTAELVAALTRRGKMPAMFQSVGVPRGRERNEPLLGHLFHPGVEVAPQPPGVLSIRYLERVRRRFAEMAADEGRKFAEAGRLAAQARAAGHKVYAIPFGHILPYELVLPGSPKCCEVLPGQPTAEQLREKLHEGDVVLYVGYYVLQPEVRDDAKERGAQVISYVCGKPDSPADQQGAAVNIDTHWTFGDTSLNLPGYDVGILPPSGVIMASAWWMLMAEMKAGR